MRLHCLLEVLYATGLRVSELVALPLSASRRDARMIVVRGKGNKERLVPLNEASRQAMADYLAAMEALKPEKKKNAARRRHAGRWFERYGSLGRANVADVPYCSNLMLAADALRRPERLDWLIDAACAHVAAATRGSRQRRPMRRGRCCATR